jgi:tellurite resistance protein TehA-like permease
MGEMITKPDANPVLLAALNWIGFGGVGYFLMGQKKKAIISIVIVLIGSVCLFGLGYIWVFVAAYDAYLLGQKLQRGESIGENENGLPFLNAIFKD